jgi:surface carbohydrate biosynthesis protein
MKILFFSLTGQRDKLVDNHIAKFLREMGHEVYVHNYASAATQSVPYIKPDVIVHPMAGADYKLNFLRYCKEWGIVNIVRRGEAGASRESLAKMDKDRQTITIGLEDYAPYVDLELVWGQEFKDILVEHGKMPADRLKVCGAFAFDLYFLPQNWRAVNETPHKTILFATGWSCADGMPDLVECGLPENSSYQNVLYNRHRAGRDLWIESIKRLITELPKKLFSFELKVRPGERTDEYRKAFGDTVKIYPEQFPAIDALKMADVLVHTGSTMAIEAHLLAIPSINFYNINPDPLLASVCPMADTYDELKTFLETVDIRKRNINERVYQELQDHLYGKIDGKACQNAAEYIHEHIKDLDIETNIPDQWPKDARYQEIGIHLEREYGDRQWTCPCCKNGYFANENERITKCPYCGMRVKLVGLNGVMLNTTTVCK